MKLPSLSFKINPVEFFLGLGLGFGYMTSLRFFGPVGIAELMVLAALIFLFKNYGRSLFRYEKSLAGFFKAYMMLAVFILLPLMTAITIVFIGLPTKPQYIISFMMGITLAFLIVESLREEYIKMSNVVIWFALAYILGNILTLLFFPSTLESDRYTGAANNPNQLMFYASSLSLLMVIYIPRLSIFLMPIVIWITLKSASDAYLLTLVVTLIIYLLIIILFSGKYSFGVGLLLSIIAGIFIFYFILSNYYDQISLIWSAADQGGSRSSLMLNALEVMFKSPFLGYGTGNFSGMKSAFESWEAHNTFLDFGMQFGMIFPAIIYFVFFAFLFNRIKNGFYVQAAFVAAFIVSGLFHFSGRHFFFWVEFAIFYYYVFYGEKTSTKKEVNFKEEYLQ